MWQFNIRNNRFKLFISNRTILWPQCQHMLPCFVVFTHFNGKITAEQICDSILALVHLMSFPNSSKKYLRITIGLLFFIQKQYRKIHNNQEKAIKCDIFQKKFQNKYFVQLTGQVAKYYAKYSNPKKDCL